MVTVRRREVCNLVARRLARADERKLPAALVLFVIALAVCSKGHIDRGLAPRRNLVALLLPSAVVIVAGRRRARALSFKTSASREAVR